MPEKVRKVTQQGASCMTWHRDEYFHLVGGVAHWLAAFVAWTKLTHAVPGLYMDGWPSSGGYTISVCNKQVNSALHLFEVA